MNKEEATTFVIQELTKHHSRNEIVIKLCQQMSMDWQGAEQFVREVENRNARTIAARQGPFLLLLALGILIVGLGMTIYSGLFFFQFNQLGAAEKVFELNLIYYRGAALLTGLGMIVGGGIGLWNSISALLAKEP
jgi:hypothetical protein